MLNKKIILFPLVLFLFIPLIGKTQDSYNLSLFKEFSGEAANDNTGWSVSSAGDVNGDGYDDFLVGSYNNDDGGSNAGAAYLIYGSATPLTSVSLSDSSVVEFTGESDDDNAGCSVSSAGDVNGDGYDDIIVGALNDDDGGFNAGAAYLIYGGATQLTSKSLAHASVVKFTGEGDGGSDMAGYSVSSAGDVNGDGYDDIIIGAAGGGAGDEGSAFLIYGSAVLLTSTSLNDVSIVEFSGEAGGDYAGNSVSSAGDVNGDGYDDIIVGAINNDDAASNAGATYLIYGNSSPLTSMSLSDGSVVEFTGEANSDNAGYSVSSAGDVNGDNYDDILVGARFNDDGAVWAGAAYLIYGSAASLTSKSLSHASVVEFTGTAIGDQAGFSVGSAGDLNKDGYDDFLVGAQGHDLAKGASFLIYGSAASLTSKSLANDTIVEFLGEADEDSAGYSASFAGDVNGDSFEDIIVGAAGNHDGGADAGAAFLGYIYIDNDHDGIPGTDGIFSGADTNDNDHDNDGSETGTDCNDDDPALTANIAYYYDYDNDGKGNPLNTTSICSATAPASYVTDNTDTNDDIATSTISDISFNEDNTSTITLST
ncbi:MAG: integrin alpha, partial [Patescibacteria group bacterium]